MTLLAAFRPSTPRATRCPRIVAAGILPAAIEMMDRFTIEAAEEAYRPGYPEGAGAVLLVELDGVAAQVEEDTAAVEALCRAGGRVRDPRPRATTPSARCSGRGARARSPRWGASRPTTTCRTASCRARGCPAVLRRIDELSAEHGLRVGNVFHAGDGNLHPLVLYDAAVEGEYERAKELADAILAACVDAGGSLTGEHGDRRRQGVRDAVDVLRARPRGVRAAAARRSTRTGSPTRGRCCRRRGSAARCPARTAPTRWRGSVSQSGSERRRAGRRARRGGRGDARRGERGGRAASGSATTSRPSGSTACSSTRRAT